MVLKSQVRIIILCIQDFYFSRAPESFVEFVSEENEKDQDEL
jgi:hypothetical protein